MSPPTTNGAPATNGNVPAKTESEFKTDSMEEAIKAVENGEMVLVMDDTDRENEGDLIIAAEKCTTEKMAFIIKHSSGYVCCAISPERADELDLPLMYPNNTELYKTAYTISVDFLQGTTTGISAHDRALTCRKLVDPSSKPTSFSRPGHILPLRARPGGILQRRGHTEAAVDLCKLAGLAPGGILCELVKPDDPMGSMAKGIDCFKFAQKYGIKILTVEQLVTYVKSKGINNGR